MITLQGKKSTVLEASKRFEPATLHHAGHNHNTQPTEPFRSQHVKTISRAVIFEIEDADKRFSLSSFQYHSQFIGY